MRLIWEEIKEEWKVEPLFVKLFVFLMVSLFFLILCFCLNSAL